MTIGPNLLTISPEELAEFVTARRGARTTAAVERINKKPRGPKTIAKLAQDLGIDKNTVLDIIKDTL